MQVLGSLQERVLQCWVVDLVFSVQSVVVLMTMYVVIGPMFYSTVVLVVLITVYGMFVHGMDP